MSEENALQKIVEASGLEKTKSAFILEKFQDYFKIADDWEKKAQVLVVTSPTHENGERGEVVPETKARRY